MNKDNMRFLERNGIDIYELNKNINCHIYTRKEENPIVADYGFQKPAKSKNVSISKIIGYDTDFRNIPSNIFQSMDYFFDSQGKGYLSRSIGMLEYNKDNIIKSLKQSFICEEISIIETGEGNYTIFFNGLHRYTLLRILYLSEISKANGIQEEIEKVNRKYTIPVKVTEIDLEKTYCKYLLINNPTNYPNNSDNPIKDISTHYDENNIPTELVEITYSDGTKDIKDKDELINFTRQIINQRKDISQFLLYLQGDYNKYKSLKNFIDEKFSDIFKVNEQNIKGRSVNEYDRLD